jgi:hypothetical protein
LQHGQFSIDRAVGRIFFCLTLDNVAIDIRGRDGGGAPFAEERQEVFVAANAQVINRAPAVGLVLVADVFDQLFELHSANLRRDRYPAGDVAHALVQLPLSLGFALRVRALTEGRAVPVILHPIRPNFD